MVTFSPLFGNMPDLDMAQFLMPISEKSKIYGRYFDPRANQVFLLTSEEGRLHFHVFSLFNIMTWEATSRLSEDIPELKGLVLRDVDSMYFNPKLRQGLIITEPSGVIQKIVVFEVDMNSVFKLRAIFTLTSVVVVYARIDDGGFIWVMQADQKIIIHQLVSPPVEVSSSEA